MTPLRALIAKALTCAENDQLESCSSCLEEALATSAGFSQTREALKIATTLLLYFRSGFGECFGAALKALLRNLCADPLEQRVM